MECLPQPIAPQRLYIPRARWTPSGLDNAMVLSDSGPGNRCSRPGLELSHQPPQPPPWAVAHQQAVLKLSWVSHPRVSVESQTTRRGRVPHPLYSSQRRLGPQSSVLVGSPVGRVAEGKATVQGGVSQERGVALARETHCFKVPSEADHGAQQVFPCPMSLSFQPQSHGAYPGPHRGPQHKALPRPLKLGRSGEPSSRSFLRTEFLMGGKYNQNTLYACKDMS